jgi:hypothetical protein
MNDATAALVRAHPDRFAVMGRLDPDDPGLRLQAQLLALGGMVGLVWILARRPEPLRLIVAVLVLVASTTICLGANAWASRVLPDGRTADGAAESINRLAYIDASHLNAHAGAAWSDEGINGLVLTLQRNGYLPLLMTRWNAAQLGQAGLLVSIAPGQAFSANQRADVQQFVERGGIFVCTVGAEDAAPSREMLADFGFRVRGSPASVSEMAEEPEPMGCRLANYIEQGARHAQVLLHAAWPIDCDKPDAVVRANGVDGLPVIVTRPVGRGTVAVIGDSKFALNANLERADGQAIQGGHLNAAFWRWFLPVLEKRPGWTPPLSEEPRAEATNADKDEADKP